MNRLYHKAAFLCSAPKFHQSPPDEGVEVAFAGRSNAGKSSALNRITGQKSLARTSKTPGRTQQLVFFQLDEKRRLVDLPGYGYAKAPLAERKRWAQAIEDYFKERQSLKGVFLMMDIRHPLTEFDQQMIEWCESCHLPLHIVLTKADKLKRGAAKNTLLSVERKLQEMTVELSVQLFSVPAKIGVDQAHQALDQWLEVTDH